MISVSNYEDAKLTQYTIYENRSGGQTLNLKDTRGGLSFVIYNELTGQVEAIDEQYMTLTAKVFRTSAEYGYEEIKQLKLVKLSKELHPQYYNGNSFAKAMEPPDGSSNFYTFDDLGELNLRDSAQYVGSIVLHVDFMACNENTSEVTCASKEQIQSYMAQRSIFL